MNNNAGNLTNDYIIYWSLFKHNAGEFYIATTKKGICYTGSPYQSFDELIRFATKRFPSYNLVEDDTKLQEYAIELKAYLAGECKEFTLAVDLKGTPFQLLIWRALTEIPYGETYSYTQIAEYIQNPLAVRAVGAAIGANPILIALPCHRIIAKNGALTGYRGGMNMKKQLLQLEKETIFT